jgi:hypothetical protein
MLNLLIASLLFSTFAHADQIEMFSANSRRVTIAKTETKAIGFAKIGGCTGFFVKTTDTNKTFVSSSRHCFKYDAPTWCKTGTARIHATSEEIKCLGVAAGTQTHDTILFEFQNIPRDRSGDFSYSNKMPAKGTRLEMIGYPKDGFLTDRTVDTLITTHNCKIVAITATNLYTNIPEVIDDKVFRHDCSTYGGNSGGPMMIEGTRTIVGIPDQYRPGSTPTTDLEDGRSIQGVRVDAYASDLAHDLTATGISVVTPVVPTLNKLAYFADGSFTDSTKKQILKVTETSFLSNTTLKSLTIGGDKFNCAQDTCKSATSSKIIMIMGSDEMKIQGLSFNRTSVD